MADLSLPENNFSTKQCSKCGEVKSVGEFRGDSRRQGYVRTVCKACDLIRTREWSRKNAEHLAAQTRQRRLDSPKVRALDKARTYRWREKNRERHLELKRMETWRRRARDKGISLEAYTQWREEKAKIVPVYRLVEEAKAKQIEEFGCVLVFKRRHRKQCPILRAYPKLKYKVFREYYLAKSKQWCKENPDKALAKKQRRRARLAGCESELSLAEWNEIKRRFNYRCAYCGKSGKMTRDHVVPLIKGGDDSPLNIVPACWSCNSSKHTGPPPRPVQTAMFA